jgi:serine/threonine protein kinase
MLDAVAYAHRSHIVHCDIKPENLILFPNNRLRLTDFGIAKIAHRTLRGSGTGTVGYMAPEQAMGKPSSRSDVFSVGLVMYRMLAGQWPEWPYEWPLPGYQRLRGKVHPDLIAFLRKAIELQPRKRFKDGDEMLRAYNRIRRKVYRKISTQRTARTRRRAA